MIPFAYPRHVSHGTYAARRCYRLAASGGSYPNSAFAFRVAFAAPSAGGDIDGIALATNGLDANDPDGDLDTVVGPHGLPAIPGNLVEVEASAGFSAGALLETGTDGRVAAVSSGIAVLRALQASGGAGAFIWCVFTSGRA